MRYVHTFHTSVTMRGVLFVAQLPPLCVCVRVALFLPRP